MSLAQGKTIRELCIARLLTTAAVMVIEPCSKAPQAEFADAHGTTIPSSTITNSRNWSRSRGAFAHADIGRRSRADRRQRADGAQHARTWPGAGRVDDERLPAFPEQVRPDRCC